MAHKESFLKVLGSMPTNATGDATVPTATVPTRRKKAEHRPGYIQKANDMVNRLAEKYRVSPDAIRDLFSQLTPQQVKASANVSSEQSEYTRGASVTPVPSGAVTPRHGELLSDTPHQDSDTENDSDKGDEENTDHLDAVASKGVTGCTSDLNQIDTKEQMGGKPEDSTESNNHALQRLLKNVQEGVESNNQALCALLENSQVEVQTQLLKRCAEALEALVKSQDRPKKRKTPSE